MTEEKDFQFVAGHLALDFVNTLDYPNEPGRSEETLLAYRDLLRFAEQTGTLAPARRRALQKTVNEAQQTKALRNSVTLRANLRALFGAVAEERPISPAGLDEFNEFLLQALRRRRLKRDGNNVIWEWEDQAGDASAPLWPIVFSAAELLASPFREQVRLCANGTCGWLFLDTSKNHSRRWCEMKTCGNRVKARNHYQRMRAAPEERS